MRLYGQNISQQRMQEIRCALHRYPELVCREEQAFALMHDNDARLVSGSGGVHSVIPAVDETGDPRRGGSPAVVEM